MTKPFDPAAIIARASDDIPVGIWIARAPGGEFIYANREFAEIMGTAGRDDVAVGEYAAPYGIYGLDGQLYPEQKMPFVRALQERRVVTCDDIVIHRHDGRRVNIRAFARPVFDDDGEISHVVIAFFDVTREMQAQAQLARSERMEAVGKLAGGIAHDFNNLLTAVRAVSTRLSERERDPERLSDLKIIDDVAARAAELTRALLGFAGRGKNFSEAVSLHGIAESLLPLLRRTLDPRIEVTLELAARHDEIAGDLSQLEQVLMNLFFNARDAMPEGGRLAVRTRNVELTSSDGPLQPGPHLVLDVVDDGAGIDPSVRDRIFEPYFTTKSAGGQRGTGLGLATAYGIVDSHHGRIEALDAQPRGTLMRLTFPLAPPTATRRPRAVGREPARSGSGTILLVEDEALVRVATFRTLKQLGYRVIACQDGDEAVELFRERHAEIAAVILDMMMPRMSGRQTYVAMRAIAPDVRVLLTTGFAHNEEVQAILGLGVRGFIAKPYEMSSLSQALAKIIAP